MSRAFVKEGDGALDPLPDLPVSPHPNYVTPRGLAALQARPDRLDKLPEAAAERDTRYLESRLRSAILIDPASLPLTSVAFGLAITVTDDAGHATTYEITGEDEADAARYRIAPQSPLARALIGAEAGDEVTWRKPSGPVTLTIKAITRPC